MPSQTGAQVIARALHDLGVTVIFGLVGIPVVDIAEEAINLGIRFIAFRNEQACSYAATAYGYMTGKPGVCLVVGGPGVLHAMAGIGNSSANAFPMLLLAGSAESHLVTKGAFQELDAISLLTPHTKIAIRPHSIDSVPEAIQNAYRTAWYGRPGTGFIDLPADIIQGQEEETSPLTKLKAVPVPPKPAADPATVSKAAQLLRSAKAPLVIIGKGAAYAQAESSIRKLVEQTQVPFLPTPMGKGVVPDAHPLNASSARSAALKNADVVLLLGARLNWILHFGSTPKWSSSVKIIQCDISPEEIGRNAGSAELGLIGDIDLVVTQLLTSLNGWRYNLPLSTSSTSYPSLLASSASKNEATSSEKALKPTPDDKPLTYQRAFHLIKETLNVLSPPDDGNIVYVSEGANTMDISRSIFPLQHPRQRLDAGTYATMGVGLGYIIAAHAAFNIDSAHAGQQQKKIVAFEGDSAFGFSAMEVETMARHRIPAIIYIMNNSGVYHGDAYNAENWAILQSQTTSDVTSSSASSSAEKKGLRSTSLLYETRYEHLASMCGDHLARGFFVRSEEELTKATQEAFQEKDKVCLINVVIEPGVGKKIGFAWQLSGKKESKSTKEKL